jgi:Uma2 family endonuclease
MATVTETTFTEATSTSISCPQGWTLADLQADLGNLPAERIILNPAPGTATELDLLRFDDENLFCELIDGVLVRKTVGVLESYLAVVLGWIIGEFVFRNNLGIVTGEGGPYRLMPGNVRYPDIAYASWDSLPGRELPDEAIAPFVPDLATEVLSKSNTTKEMDRKLKDYFKAGVKMVWYIDPKTKTARCYTGVDQCISIDESGELVGDPVLPGFRLKLADLFAMATRQGPPAKQ